MERKKTTTTIQPQLLRFSLAGFMKQTVGGGTSKNKHWSLGRIFFEKKKRIKVEEQKLALWCIFWLALRKECGSESPSMYGSIPSFPTEGHPVLGDTQKTYDHINLWIDTANSRHVNMYFELGILYVFLVQRIFAKARHTSDTSR